MADLGDAGTRTPGHPNSFDFMQLSGKFGKIVSRGVGAPTPGEILDPPLLRDLFEKEYHSDVNFETDSKYALEISMPL